MRSGTNSHYRFVSESIKPDISQTDTHAMAVGEPGLPRMFTWRKQPLHIKSVIRTWKETGRCRNGSSERYVRKHWFEVETQEHSKAMIYFERQARGRNAKQRWWLQSIAS